MPSKPLVLGIVVVAAVLCSTLGATQGPPAPGAGPRNADWPVYRGDQKGNQYAPLAQIHAANVHKLQPAWEYRTGDANERSTMHVNPDRRQRGDVHHHAEPEGSGAGRARQAASSGRSIRRSTTTATSSGCATAGSTYWKGAEGERIFHFVRDRVYALDAEDRAR